METSLYGIPQGPAAGFIPTSSSPSYPSAVDGYSLSTTVEAYRHSTGFVSFDLGVSLTCRQAKRSYTRDTTPP